MLTLQEMFNTQSVFTFEQAQLLGDFNELWNKYKAEASNPKAVLSYHAGIQAIADKHDLDYDMPTHMGVLSAVEGVGSPTTTH